MRIPEDNAVMHHFQHISAVFFAAMIVAIYLQYTLLGMEQKGWVSVQTSEAMFFISGFICTVIWFLWFFRSRHEKWELFDTTYRVLLLVSAIVGAILGRIYVLG
jgi:phosphoglycerol transferase MdoB-like AlkP superfamily enzyme